MAKNVASPARTSVKNLEPFLSCLCPENSSRNRRPTMLLATAVFVFSTYTCIRVLKAVKINGTYPAHDGKLCTYNYVVGKNILFPSRWDQTVNS